MTWYYRINTDSEGTETGIDVWDHTQTPATDAPLTNIPAPFTVPDDVESVMRERWESEANLGNSPVMNIYAGEVLMHLATGDIEEYRP